MSAQVTPNVRVMPAREVVVRMLRVAEALYTGDARLSVQTALQHLQWNIGLSKGKPNSDELKKVLSFLDEHRYLVANNCTLQSNQTPHRQISYITQDGVIATFQFSNFPDTQHAMTALAALSKEFELSAAVDLVSGISGAGVQTALQLRERAAADLSAALQRLESSLVEISLKDAENRQKLQKELEDRYQAKIDALESQIAQEKAELAAWKREAEAALEQKEKEHAQKVAEFETHEAKYIRRQLLRQQSALLDESKELKLSAATDKKRRPIRWATLLTSFVFFGLASVAGYFYFESRDLHYVGPFTAGVLGFSATMLYFIKWNDEWFRQHADNEVESKRYKADILRASWIAELVSEWSEDGKAPPQELLQVFAKNLFNVGADKLAMVEHPADVVFGLLKRARKLDVGTDHVSIEAGSARSSVTRT